MARRGGSKLEQKHVKAIAKKLNAIREEKPGKHIFYSVFFQDRLITSFGMCHSPHSKHGHIPAQLFISESQAHAMGSCTISKEEYFQILQKKGKLFS